MPRYAQLPNLSPARLDLSVYRGDTLSMRLQLRAMGRPINVSEPGWEFWCHAKDKVDGKILAIIDVPKKWPIVGVLQMVLTDDQTQLLPEDSVWDLESRDPNNRVRTLLRGTLTVTPDVTVVLL
jgi:hypothetical protein